MQGARQPVSQPGLPDNFDPVPSFPEPEFVPENDPDDFDYDDPDEELDP